MKQYNGEKAIISLTSWKARIKTVSKTIYSLIQKCPGFHIVLVLSEEEFPKKEEELPDDLMLFIENDLIELMWVYKNYKCFKKILFTMEKYPDIPVISADDDCVYTHNYAEELYNKWEKNKEHPISYKYYMNGRLKARTCGMLGCATIWPNRKFFDKIDISFLDFQPIIDRNQDDPFYQNYIKMFKKPYIILLEKTCPLTFSNEIKPLHDVYTKRNYGRETDKLYIKFLKKL